MSSFRKLKRLSHHTLLFCFLLIAILPPTAECSFRLCGFKLTMTLQALCKNKFCGGFVVNTLSGPQQPASGDQTELDGSSSAAVEQQRNAIFLYTPSYQKRSGIATECCEKRCTFSYLKTYCCAGFDNGGGGNNNKPQSSKRASSPFFNYDSNRIIDAVNSNFT